MIESQKESQRKISEFNEKIALLQAELSQKVAQIAALQPGQKDQLNS